MGLASGYLMGTHAIDHVTEHRNTPVEMYQHEKPGAGMEWSWFTRSSSILESEACPTSKNQCQW
jgi:hypothetical protein